MDIWPRYSFVFIFIFFNSLVFAQSLQINSITPGINQNYVSSESNIIIEFNMSVTGGSVNDTTLFIKGSQTGKINGVYSGGGTATITFNPDNNFRAGEIISTTITTRIKTAGGLSLNRGYTYSFTVASGTEIVSPLTFVQHTVSGTSSQGRDAKPMDWDGDGDLDIISSSEGLPERIYVAENNGFNEFCTFAIGGTFRNPEVHDIDGDGDYDSFGTNGNASQINWYENWGSSPDSLHIISGEDPWTMTGGDIDSDGDIDVLAAVLRISPLSHRLFWFANDGRGNFSSSMEIATTFDGGSDSYFYIRDMNSDGVMDILAFHRDAFDLVWYENDGNESFTEHPIDNTINRMRLTTGDIDDDGDMDIVAVSTDNNPTEPVTLYENLGDGSFSEHPIVATTTSRLYNTRITDVNGDQAMDILAGGYWFENDGSESFTEHIISEGLKTGANYSANGIDYADMDDDGDMDIISLGYYELSWQENSPLMEITSHSPLNAALNISPTADIIISFDHVVDNNTLTQNTIRVYSQNRGWLAGSLSGGGTQTVTFNPETNFKLGEIIEVTVTNRILSAAGHSLAKSAGFSFQIQSLAVEEPSFSIQHIFDHMNNISGFDIADMDGDGDLDLLSCSWYELYWHENDGNGNFTSDSISISDNPIAVHAIDQNGDGFMDIIVDNDGSAAGMFYLNDGNQNFTESGSINNIRLKQLTDINKDGLLDFLYTSRVDNYLRWFGQSVCEAYLAHGFMQNLYGRDAQSADMDNDGDTDFITAATTGPVFYNNNGYMIFTAAAFAEEYTTSVYLSDLDNDGDLDPVFSEANTGIIWYENRLTGDSLDFGGRRQIGLLTYDPPDVITTDIDGDGDQDIVSLSKADNKVVWYINRLNEPTADFGPQQGSAMNLQYPVKVLSADLDGDEDMDLVTISEGDDALNWFKNSGGVTSIEHNKTEAPLTFSLDQNYPNPFNPTTTISYQIKNQSDVQISIYDISGKTVKVIKDNNKPAGAYTLTFDASELASGIYIYKLKAGSFEKSRKMVLLR